MELNISQLTLEEVEEFEGRAGMPIGAITAQNLPSRALRALIWILRRRVEPDFTWEMAGDLTIGEINFAGMGIQNPPA